jgi:hypothetical protein
MRDMEVIDLELALLAKVRATIRELGGRRPRSHRETTHQRTQSRKLT